MGQCGYRAVLIWGSVVIGSVNIGQCGYRAVLIWGSVVIGSVNMGQCGYGPFSQERASNGKDNLKKKFFCFLQKSGESPSFQ